MMTAQAWQGLFGGGGSSLLILAVQGLFALALWSLRRAFVRSDEWLLHLQREARSESELNGRLSVLEERVRELPAASDMAALHGELAALRGEIQALNARISGLDRLLARLEHGLDRQEDRLGQLPAEGGRR
ncbi:MAG: DUF2730 family protein [Desulfovibrio sp.]|uniref:DUF2730 family protein n=1 Tax=Desulfovibrio sp. TaxID=885 RepID=UPI001A76BD3A|nr:DUF2730 family protein [Desulfovibrio sp.]MBD5416507.1 DUF2730 family protein [Desulfovibrio sp.]